MFELLTENEVLELWDKRGDLIGDLKAQRRKDAQALLRQKRTVYHTNGIEDKITVEFSPVEWHEINLIAESEWNTEK